jgi:hypothetical protein
VVLAIRALSQAGGLVEPTTALPPASASRALDGTPAPDSSAPDSQPVAQPADPSTPRATGAVEVPGDAGPTDWWAVLEILDARRSAALAARDRELVGEYAKAGSAAWIHDTAVIEDLRTRGLIPVGLSTRIIGIEEVSEPGAAEQPQGEPGESGGSGEPGWPGDSGEPGDSGDSGAGVQEVPGEQDVPGRATLVLVDRRSDYQVRDERGAAVADVPASAPRRWRVTVVPDASADAEVAWRIEAVDALP